MTSRAWLSWAEVLEKHKDRRDPEELLNKLFNEAIQGPEGLVRVQELGSEFIRERQQLQTDPRFRMPPMVAVLEAMGELPSGYVAGEPEYVGDWFKDFRQVREEPE